MKRVDFFIVGAMRAGTSSLRDALQLNPHIDIPQGEPNFFSNSANYVRGVEYYHALFDWDRPCLTRGEKSPQYAVKAISAERLQAYNPAAKIIWTLRDPVKRAISHYQHSRFRTEDAYDLSFAVKKRRKLENRQSSMAYVYRSEYHKQIRHWLKFFPREQHHFIILEEMLAEPETELRQLHRFLEVPWHEAVKLPHSKNKKMAKFAKEMEIDTTDAKALAAVLSGTRPAVEGILGRPIPAWTDGGGVRGWLARTFGR